MRIEKLQLVRGGCRIAMYILLSSCSVFRTSDTNLKNIKKILNEHDLSKSYKVSVIDEKKYPFEPILQEHVVVYKVFSRKEDIYLTIDTVNNCTTSVLTENPDSSFIYNSEIENILLEQFNFCGDTLRH